MIHGVKDWTRNITINNKKKESLTSLWLRGGSLKNCFKISAKLRTKTLPFSFKTNCVRYNLPFFSIFVHIKHTFRHSQNSDHIYENYNYQQPPKSPQTLNQLQKEIKLFDLHRILSIYYIIRSKTDYHHYVSYNHHL